MTRAESSGERLNADSAEMERESSGGVVYVRVHLFGLPRGGQFVLQWLRLIIGSWLHARSVSYRFIDGDMRLRELAGDGEAADSEAFLDLVMLNPPSETVELLAAFLERSLVDAGTVERVLVSPAKATTAAGSPTQDAHEPKDDAPHEWVLQGGGNNTCD